MRIAVPLFSLFLLTACSAGPAMSRADLMQGFDPVSEHIPKYDQVMAQPYAPQVRGQGVEAVQLAVNANPYVADGAAMEWSPATLWTEGGDCEDYALAKILELKAQGNADSFFMVVTSKSGDLNHAVALVETPEGIDVLDNEQPRPVPLGTLLKEWRPIYVIDTKTRQTMKAKAGVFL